MSYMEINVTEAFEVAKGNKNQGLGCNGINILAFEGHKKVRGRIGQGHGWESFFNGVDCQDFKRQLHPSEMQQMGAEGNY